VRAVLEEEARATQAYVHETAARLDAELLGRIEAAGVAVNAPDRTAFVSASRAVYDEFAETVAAGSVLVEAASAAGSR